MQSMLRIENLTVRIGDRYILKDFSLNINSGETHILLGPNGAGKTTLIRTLLGFSGYPVESGKIYFQDQDITNMPTSERVSLGLGVLFQTPPPITGVKLHRLLSICGQKRAKALKQNINACDDEIDPKIIELGKRLQFPPSYLNRDVNVGFSGGEIKRSEILQMMVLQPSLLLFDEPDSGLDLEATELVAGVMRELLEMDVIPSKQKKSGLIITHLGYILKFLGHITKAHILIDGKIACSGDPNQIFTSIRKSGFEGCKDCLSCAERSHETKGESLL